MTCINVWPEGRSAGRARGNGVRVCIIASKHHTSGKHVAVYTPFLCFLSHHSFFLGPVHRRPSIDHFSTDKLHQMTGQIWTLNARSAIENDQRPVLVELSPNSLRLSMLLCVAGDFSPLDHGPTCAQYLYQVPETC